MAYGASAALINPHSKLEKIQIKDLVKWRNTCLRQTNGLVGQTGKRALRYIVISCREDCGDVEILVKCWQDLESMTSMNLIARSRVHVRQRRAENHKKKNNTA
jgi:hypothetical protein